METLPLDILTYIIVYCKESLTFLVCKKWLEIYTKKT